MQPQSASIVGARGYTGLELARLLLKHPGVRLTHCFATKEFKLSDDILENGAEKVACLTDEQLFDNLTDIVFLATPAEVSLALAPKILKAGKKVIDLSGAFRLKMNDTMKWYGFTHSAPEALNGAEYGLLPFCGPLNKKTRLIANPGCYASAISLALVPLIKRGLIDTDSLVIDAKSGTTGAGKKAQENLLFAEVDGECLPYRVGKHQHLPEIQETVSHFAGKQIDPHFVTHLLPAKRGIVASIFARSETRDIQDVTLAYTEDFGNYPLVRFGPEYSKLAKLQGVVGTPFTHISYELIGDKLYVFSVIDNLMKGAASQAVENLNRFLDLPPHFSLHGAAN
ncbi:MAG TPA: N-acetyl-gamma-glutamyl-phosphate reductase [Bdellovibrionales bacterium]|nr:N-acetyl-gamma-glutamyl-phosphate reductase [Bdellovibrionales bacterium]